MQLSSQGNAEQEVKDEVPEGELVLDLEQEDQDVKQE